MIIQLIIAENINDWFQFQMISRNEIVYIFLLCLIYDNLIFQSIEYSVPFTCIDALQSQAYVVIFLIDYWMRHLHDVYIS